MSNWDILHLPEDEWEHIQILDRLHDEGINCFFTDMWLDDIVILVGCDDTIYNIANALNIPTSIIFADTEHSFFIINLYQLKAIRCGVDKQIEEFR